MARSHGVAVTRRSGLVLAALAALMLSACAPGVAAVRLPSASKAADHSCVHRKCGANAVCVKERGNARCTCNPGFSMTPTGCVGADACALKACGSNGKCIKDSAGVASCVCDTGFVLQTDGITCTDTCALKSCGVNGRCIKDAITGVASCVCDTGFALQADGRTCTDTCTLKACRGNGTCIKNSTTGVASCVCDSGFELEVDGKTCTDTCALKACGGNGTCIKSSTTGAASCVCDTGFVLQADGRTCTDTCVIKGCNAVVTDCVKDTAGAASCVCKAGYQNVSGTCMGPASCGTCPPGATCVVVPYTKAAYCLCPPGFGMTTTGCDLGATPTVSSTSFSFYTLPSFGITPAAYTMRLTYNGCTNLTASTALDIQSYCDVERAPGGAGDCTEIRQYYQPGCVGAYSLFPVTQGTGVSTATTSNYPGYPFRSFACSITEKCAPSTCGGNGSCVQDSAGVAFCVCNAGFLLQPDARTCAEACGTKICDPTTDCVRDAAGGASCVCKAGYQSISGACVGPATCGSCPAGATCTVAFGFIPYCICPPGYGMTSTGCISGATPTVSSTSITFYDQPSYTITTNTFTMRLEFNACTTLPASAASEVWSTLRLDGAPGGVGECVSLNQYEQEGCAGAYTSSPSASDGTSMAGLGFTKYLGYPYRSFSCNGIAIP